VASSAAAARDSRNRRCRGWERHDVGAMMLESYLQVSVRNNLADNVIGVIAAKDLELRGDLLALANRLVGCTGIDDARNYKPDQRGACALQCHPLTMQSYVRSSKQPFRGVPWVSSVGFMFSRLCRSGRACDHRRALFSASAPQFRLVLCPPKKLNYTCLRKRFANRTRDSRFCFSCFFVAARISVNH
jgi:hypothetical protein